MDNTTRAAALACAVEAARAAGERIRKDFHLPGGPQGHGSHAAVDEEAEMALRAFLERDFPQFGYRGEETLALSPDRRKPFWLVDPNDGTSAFLKGHRGSAVSIALIDGGEPVLGVVYAPCAPDDRGDLIAWTEGAPLTRNGLPVERAKLPAALARDAIVLLNHEHEGFPVRTQEYVHPARFRCVPSVAYRLALVAVGDAEAAVSTGGPTDWDVAGGHALLRGVGGDLVDSRGAPVRYRHSFADNVYGGDPAVARVLASRGRVNQKATELPTILGLGLVAPVRAEAIGDPGLLSRAQGCLLGQLAGDALGSRVEFQSERAIAREHPGGVRDLLDGGTWDTLAGQPTDDSELALTLARCIARDGAFVPERVAEGYRAWLASGPFDAGTTTRAGLRGDPLQDSQSNGSLMRASPLGVFGHALEPDHLARLAREDSALSHPNAVCQDACAAFTTAIAFALRTGAPAREVYGFARGEARRMNLAPSVQEALERAEAGAPEDFQRRQGWVLVALQNAFHALASGPSLEDALVATVGRGGDTDTNGAIAGALLGAVHGREAVPRRWQRAVLSCRPTVVTGNVHHPRPVTFWPVDALVLAERLLLAGRRTTP
ncbi:MAG: ADP-ribosylglycohydrolase family protein [Deltaproteobacteria bacterium]|nr:ADP-ribosylglycohydrolase family protein [Deltaproteobacteria bacterium]